MDDGGGIAISEEELEEALEQLVDEGEFDYLLEPGSHGVLGETEETVATVAEYFERSGDDLADVRVAHAARRAVGLYRNMLASLLHGQRDAAAEVVETAAVSIEFGIEQVYASLSGVAAA